jgi:hypothetical protein
MRPCRVRILWSDDTTSVCPQTIINDDDTECYAHKKYFEKVKLADGELHYQSGPCYSDRRRSGNRFTEGQLYIKSVTSGRRKVTRRIGDEESE